MIWDSQGPDHTTAATNGGMGGRRDGPADARGGAASAAVNARPGAFASTHTHAGTASAHVSAADVVMRALSRLGGVPVHGDSATQVVGARAASQDAARTTFDELTRQALQTSVYNMNDALDEAVDVAEDNWFEESAEEARDGSAEAPEHEDAVLGPAERGREWRGPTRTARTRDADMSSRSRSGGGDGGDGGAVMQDAAWDGHRATDRAYQQQRTHTSITHEPVAPAATDATEAKVARTAGARDVTEARQPPAAVAIRRATAAAAQAVEAAFGAVGSGGWVTTDDGAAAATSNRSRSRTISSGAGGSGSGLTGASNKPSSSRSSSSKQQASAVTTAMQNVGSSGTGSGWDIGSEFERNLKGSRALLLPATTANRAAATRSNKANSTFGASAGHSRQASSATFRAITPATEFLGRAAAFDQLAGRLPQPEHKPPAQSQSARAAAAPAPAPLPPGPHRSVAQLSGNDGRASSLRADSRHAAVAGPAASKAAAVVAPVTSAVAGPSVRHQEHSESFPHHADTGDIMADIGSVSGEGSSPNREASRDAAAESSGLEDRRHRGAGAAAYTGEGMEDAVHTSQVHTVAGCVPEGYSKDSFRLTASGRIIYLSPVRGSGSAAVTAGRSTGASGRTAGPTRDAAALKAEMDRMKRAVSHQWTMLQHYRSSGGGSGGALPAASLAPTQSGSLRQFPCFLVYGLQTLPTTYGASVVCACVVSSLSLGSAAPPIASESGAMLEEGRRLLLVLPATLSVHLGLLSSTAAKDSIRPASSASSTRTLRVHLPVSLCDLSGSSTGTAGSGGSGAFLPAHPQPGAGTYAASAANSFIGTDDSVGTAPWLAAFVQCAEWA